MRVLAVVESESWIDHHVVGSLRDMGHCVATFFYGPAVGEFYGAARRGQLLTKNAELLALARRMAVEAAGLDLIFCYVYDDFLLPETARELAALGRSMVNFNVDMVNQWYRQTRTARFFTAILCAQRINMSALASHGAKTIYFPMAARDPQRAADGSESDGFCPSAPVTFLGTPMPVRARVLGYLHDAGIPLAIYGKYWREGHEASPEYSFEKTVSDLRHYGVARLRHEGFGALTEAIKSRVRPRKSVQPSPLPATCIHGFLPQRLVPALFARSKINIGFTRMTVDDPWRSGLNQVKLRDFEVPMAGGFYLVEKAPDYRDLFKIGAEVETWVRPEELLDKIRYFLSHESERADVARNGHQRALRDHTWQKRFADLFRTLGLNSQ